MEDLAYAACQRETLRWLCPADRPGFSIDGLNLVLDELRAALTCGYRVCFVLELDKAVVAFMRTYQRVRTFDIYAGLALGWFADLSPGILAVKFPELVPAQVAQLFDVDRRAYVEALYALALTTRSPDLQACLGQVAVRLAVAVWLATLRSCRTREHPATLLFRENGLEITESLAGQHTVIRFERDSRVLARAVLELSTTRAGEVQVFEFAPGAYASPVSSFTSL